ncbi:MAG: hypothetical protein A3C55_03935 [Gammaproteobacteria bacterium RIFCSPHIGHO2_02_FULL_42_13]|nr:MAG: hypothetical protein A3C55_03935 [Gammaproteobacteria bacterium RIFCSPHIGHO2_02_FULL_42_13]
MQVNRSFITYHVKGLLFDMDGTLVDSTPVVERTWRRFADRYDLDLNEILDYAHGRRTLETVTHFAPAYVDIKKEATQLIAEEVADVEGIVAIAGSVNLLQALPLFQWAIVTSASRKLALRRMCAANIPIPPVLITAEDVGFGKPSPDGYLAAAQALKLSSKDCIVFEDSSAGLSSACAAGMRAFAVGERLKTSQLSYEQWIPDFNGLQLCVPFLPVFPAILKLKVGQTNTEVLSKGE